MHVLAILAIRFWRLALRGCLLGRFGPRSQGSTGMMDYVRNRFGQMAIGVEARQEFDGADDRVGRDLDGHGPFNDGAESEANGARTTVEKSCGVCVTIDRRVIGDAVVCCDLVWAAPAEEILLDGFAVAVAADAALAAVPCRRGTPLTSRWPEAWSLPIVDRAGTLGAFAAV